MIRIQAIEHEFVRSVPKELKPGVLYISMEYATAVHACCCGCGDQVVTPFTPTDWKMTYDGATVSLLPSVGNWNQKCRSHYVISGGRVIEAGPWSQAQVDAERRRDRRAKARFYESSGAGESNAPPNVEKESKPASATPSGAKSLWSSLRRWLLL